jgi:hypothetical protein
VTEAEEDAAFCILERFGIGLYRRGENLPGENRTGTETRRIGS